MLICMGTSVGVAVIKVVAGASGGSVERGSADEAIWGFCAIGHQLQLHTVLDRPGPTRHHEARRHERAP